MVTLDIPIRLQPKQWKLYEKLTKGKARIIGAGGGRGSAKSGGIDRIALTLMMEQPGITICIVMRTYEQLRKYHIDPLLRTYPQLKDHYLKTSKKLTLPNGSQLDLGYAENYDAVEEFFRSANYKYIFLDQGEQFLELEIREMYKACRWPSGGAKMAISHNMGGVGIQTFRKWFHSKEYQPRENPDNYDFVKFNPWDPRPNGLKNGYLSANTMTSSPMRSGCGMRLPAVSIRRRSTPMKSHTARVTGWDRGMRSRVLTLAACSTAKRR